MKKLFCLLCVTILALSFTVATAQETKKESKFGGLYYETRRTAHNQEGLPEGSVVFMGNSITEQGWWNMLFKVKNIVNRGIGGDNTYGMVDRMPEILASRPQKVFLMAGINDISLGFPQDTIVSNIRKMVKMSRKMAPSCKFYVQSVLPLNENRLAFPLVKGKNPVVRDLNSRLKTMCEEEGIMFLDIASLLSDPNGDLRIELTKDGLHIHSQAYVIWADYLKRSGLLK
ncbi:MAG: GDSL family lipase [Bacteroidetes bacterium GWF2_40_14]|nr:MAG: GDSL family lipase [Bacteroidetes bacterium GWF2_40_14]